MGNIYNSENVFSGWASNACVAMVGSDGFVYTSPNVLTGWASSSCVGRVDTNTHYVYSDTNVFNGWASSACKGEYDEGGFIYRDKPTLRGYASSACIGHFAGGYIYVDKNWVTGFGSGACVGKADNVADAAAFLLLILPKLRAGSAPNPGAPQSHQQSSNSQQEQSQSQSRQTQNDQDQSQTQKKKKQSLSDAFSLPWWIWIIIITVVVYAFAIGISILMFIVQCLLYTVPGWCFFVSGIALAFTLPKYSAYKGDRMKSYYPEAWKKSVPIIVVIAICFIIQVLIDKHSFSEKLPTLICGFLYVAIDAYLIMLRNALKFSAGVFNSTNARTQNYRNNQATKDTGRTNTGNAFDSFLKGNQPVNRSAPSPQPNNSTPQQKLVGWIITTILAVMLIGVIIALGGIALGLF